LRGGIPNKVLLLA